VELTFEQVAIGGTLPGTLLKESIDVYPGLDNFANVEVEVKAPVGYQRRLYATSITGVVPEVIPDTTDRIDELLWLGGSEKSGATYTDTEKAAIADFLGALSGKSYRTKVKYVLPFFGNDITTQLYPIYDINFYGPPTNANFVDADGTTLQGLKGNGSSKILTLPFRFNNLGGFTNFGMGVWFNDWDTAGTAGGNIGSMWNGGVTQVYGTAVSGANIDFQAGAFANVARLAGTGEDNRDYYGQKFSDTSRKIFRDGVLLNENVTNDTSSDMAFAFPYLFGDNLGGTRYNSSSLHCAYYTNGLLTDPEVADLHSLIQTYLITAVGR